MTTLEITLSDDIARRASAAGLLTRERLDEILSAEMRRTAGDRLSDIMAKIHAVSGPEMSMDEVTSEIKAVRRERRERREATNC
jgi:hypothetical protein